MVNLWGGKSIQWVSHAWKDNGIFIISFHALIICPFAPWSWQQFALIHTLQTWSADHTADRTCQVFPSELSIYFDIYMDLAILCCVARAGWCWWERGTEWCKKLGSWLKWGVSLGCRLGSFASLFAILCYVEYCLKEYSSHVCILFKLKLQNLFRALFSGRVIHWKGWLLIRLLVMGSLQKFHTLCESFRITQLA